MMILMIINSKIPTTAPIIAALFPPLPSSVVNTITVENKTNKQAKKKNKKQKTNKQTNKKVFQSASSKHKFWLK